MHITRYIECRPLTALYLNSYEIISRDNVHMFVIPTKFPSLPPQKTPKNNKNKLYG